jgi:hypothetical protein
MTQEEFHGMVVLVDGLKVNLADFNALHFDPARSQCKTAKAKKGLDRA